MNRTVLSLALASLVSLGALPSQAADGPWNHNGSTVYMSDGSDYYPHELKIWYTDPRSGMRAEGVRNGTLLFHGTEYDNGYVEGTAYVFKQGCAPAGYDVSGTFVNNADYLVLAGSAPIWSGCRVVGYSDNKNSTLAFEYQGIND